MTQAYNKRRPRKPVGAMAPVPVKAPDGWLIGVVVALVIIGTLTQSLNPDLCWVLANSFALQLLLVLTAQALRREAERQDRPSARQSWRR